MTAVDDYRKSSYVVQFGGRILPEDVAVVREVFIKMEERADAAIAELETKLADCAKTCGGLEYRLEQAEAEETTHHGPVYVMALEARAARLEHFHRVVMHHWTCAPDDPRRRRYVLQALLDAILDAHDEVVR